MQLTSKSFSGQRCCLTISAVQKLPNSHLEQKNSTWRWVEMSCVVLSRA